MKHLTFANPGLSSTLAGRQAGRALGRLGPASISNLVAASTAPRSVNIVPHYHLFFTDSHIRWTHLLHLFHLISELQYSLPFSTITKVPIVETGGLAFDLDNCPNLLTNQPTHQSPANICLLHKFWFWLSNDIIVIFQIFAILPKLTTAPISPTPNQPNQRWHVILKLQQQAPNVGPQGRWELGLGCNLQFQSWLSSVACLHISKSALFQSNKEGADSDSAEIQL